MGRRKGRTPPSKPFEDAFEQIDTLEQNVFDRTNDASFTGEQLVDWLLPEDVVSILKTAFPVIREVDRTQFWHLDIILPLVFPAVACSFTIKVNSPEIKMLVPKNGLIKPTHDPGIMAGIRHAYEVHERFEKVRRVVRWLNEYATVGAARHYCPWLTSVLPAAHPFQEATGQTYREPTMSMVAIAGPMRECGAIMASALLCGEPGDRKTNGLFKVTFSGVRDGTTSYVSKYFELI